LSTCGGIVWKIFRNKIRLWRSSQRRRGGARSFESRLRTLKPNSAGGFIEVNLPSALKPMGFIGNKNGSARMHEAVFYTFTKMEDTGEHKPSVDHINRKNVIAAGLTA
jgi:hypothetical protein